MNTLPVKEVTRYLKPLISSIKTINKLRSNHYRNISKDVLGTGSGSPRRLHFGNQCLNQTE